MTNRSKPLFLILFISLLASMLAPGLPAKAAEGSGQVTFDMAAEVGYLSGSTAYHITIPTVDGLLESELDWPLDSWVGGVRFSLGKEQSWSFELSLHTNLSEDTGSMEDSDWIDGVRFIFSTSDTSMDSFSALLFDISGRRTLVRKPNFTLAGVAGFLYEDFDLTASNLEQTSPVGLAGFDASVAGPVVTYTVQHRIPYAGVSLGFHSSPSLEFFADLLAGYAFVEDEDDHLLRFKLATSEADGPAFLARLRSVYRLSDRFSMTAVLDFLTLSADGTQDQVFYAGPDAGFGFAGIDNTIDTSRLMILLGALYQF